MPLYTIQTEPGSQQIASYPVYQGFLSPATVNGVQIPFYNQRQDFFNLWPNYLQELPNAATGDGTTGTYTINLPFFPAIPGHVDMTGIVATKSVYGDPPVVTTFIDSIPTTSVYSGVFFIATGTSGQTMIVADSGQFLSGNQGYGLLMNPGPAPFGNTACAGGYNITNNTVNYATGVATVNFPSPVAAGTNISAECYFYNQGMPTGILFYNNVLTIRPPPNISYLIELEAYLSPAAFISSSSYIPFAYMSEYIARGAARKILSDTGDVEQFMFYEPLFREQEQLVWKRSQRQFTATRTQTLYSGGQGQNGANSVGMGAN